MSKTNSNSVLISSFRSLTLWTLPRSHLVANSRNDFRAMRYTMMLMMMNTYATLKFMI